MGCEDNTIRTTVYLPKGLYGKVQKERSTNKNFSLSGFVKEQLTKYFYGDEYELQTQLQHITKRLDEIDKENNALLSRKTELQERMQNQKQKKDEERQLYKRFIKNCNGRIRQIKKFNIAPDYNQITNHFHRSFFPGNNINIKTVKQILHMVKTNKMNFDTFQQLRKGDFSGN